MDNGTDVNNLRLMIREEMRDIDAAIEEEKYLDSFRNLNKEKQPEQLLTLTFHRRRTTINRGME